MPPEQPTLAQTPPTQVIPSPHPDLQRPPAGPQPITMDHAVYQSMIAERQALAAERDELKDFKAKSIKEWEAKESERLVAVAKAGQVEEALAETRKQGDARTREWQSKYEQLDTRVLAKVRDAIIAESLNGRVFAGQDPAQTAALVRRLLAEEIEASRDSQGNEIVYDRTTRRPAVDYLKERLESPAFSVFFAPSQRGGAGTDGTRTQAPQANEDPTTAYMREVRERMALARSDPSRVFSQ